MKIGTVINYCENDHKFLQACVDNVRKFSNDIVIAFCEKMFDGSNQDLSKIQHFHMRNPDIKFISFPFDTAYQRAPRDGHNKCRVLGYNYLKGKVDKILFLDVDEIIESDLFIDWLNTSEDPQKYWHINFACHWYYREPYWRATQHEFCGSFHDMNHIDEAALQTGAERWFWLNDGEHGKRYAVSPKEKIMFHHYSWVRTKEEMLKKVKTWGHKNDRDWANDIEICFRVGFNGNPRKELQNRTETVHNYNYVKVDPYVTF